MTYTPQRGDLVLLDSGLTGVPQSDVIGLVLSGKEFNQNGLALICPVDLRPEASARTYGTVVTLQGTGLKTHGAIHCHQLRVIDWQVRRARFEEAVSKKVIDEVLARSEAVLLD